jgi:hypothetical protein
MNTRILSTVLLASAVALGVTLADDGSKNTSGERTANSVKDVVVPESESGKVTVIMTDDHITMPRDLRAGRTGFVVRNEGKARHNFKIEGQGIEKEFMAGVAPADSKTLDVDLKPGNYRIFVPGQDPAYVGTDVTITVRTEP